jgi:hypothetical protein
MKTLAGRKAHQPDKGILQISFIVLVSFIILNAQVYGSTDIPVNATATPVAIGAAALFAGFGGGSGLTSQGIVTAANGEFVTTAASTFVTAFRDEEAVYTETRLDVEPLNGTVHTDRTACTDSCSL